MTFVPPTAEEFEEIIARRLERMPVPAEYAELKARAETPLALPDPPDLDQARREGEHNVLRARAPRVAAAELRLAAMRHRFHDVTDALAHLDPASFVDDEGEVDEQAITAAVADLAERRPYLTTRGAR